MEAQTRLEIRENIRSEIRGILGNLRSVASELKARNLTDDEERCFKLLLRDLCHACKVEISRLAGVEETARMLDPFGKFING